jgi:DNA repair exonuclease SbcCD ATPase subunit
MFDALKPLLESGIVNEETRAEIQEAWESHINETREQVRSELREEFSRRYEHDKETMVEALDKMVTEGLTAEIEQVIAERKSLEEDRVKFNSSMNEQSEKFQNFMSEKLAEELAELNEDRKAQAETLDKLQQFVVNALAEEIAEFHKDKQSVVEAKVKLVAEGKQQIENLKAKFIDRASKLVQETVTKNLNSELTQLKEDIDSARQNNFGRKIFETFAAEFATSYLNENEDIKELQTQVAEVKAQLEEAKQALEEKSTIVESKEAEIRMINDRIARDQKLSEMMAPLSREQKEVMGTLLESVQTARLEASFNKYLPAVLKNDAKATTKILAESKEVTGNKKETKQDADEGKIIEIKRLAGLQ